MDDILEAERHALLALRAAAARRALPDRDRGRRHEDRARPSPRRLHRDAAAEPVLRRRARRRCRRGSSPTTASTWSSGRSPTSARTRRGCTAKEVELPIIGCCCPACGDLSLQRQRVKRLIMDLEVEHPGVKQSMLKALGNVMPRHLLDTRLNPSGELRDSAALRLEEEAPASSSRFSLVHSRKRPYDAHASRRSARDLGARPRRRPRDRRDRARPARAARRRPRRHDGRRAATSPARSATCACSRATPASRWIDRSSTSAAGARRLAVHALRRRAQGPPAVVRRGRAA